MMRYYDRDIDYDDASWYDIPGHPNYQASLRDHIRHKKTKHVLKPMVDKDGYYRMSLGSIDNVPVHRAVCMAIIGEPPDGKSQVNHIDCDRQNNSFLNLEWVSPRENIMWAIQKGSLNYELGLKRASEVNPKPVRIVETGETFNSVKECAEYFNIKPTNISCVLTGYGNRKTVHGYHLEYVKKEVC